MPLRILCFTCLSGVALDARLLSYICPKGCSPIICRVLESVKFAVGVVGPASCVQVDTVSTATGETDVLDETRVARVHDQ